MVTLVGVLVKETTVPGAVDDTEDLVLDTLLDPSVGSLDVLVSLLDTLLVR